MRSMKDIPYELVQYPKKAIYKKTGQPIEFADIIVSGEVNIKLESKTGKRATVISYGIGRIVAPSVIFSKSGIFPVTLEVSKPTTFLRMTPESLLKVMSRNKKIQQNFIRRLSSICYELIDTLNLITLHTVREKVAIFLLNESNLFLRHLLARLRRGSTPSGHRKLSEPPAPLRQDRGTGGREE